MNAQDRAELVRRLSREERALLAAELREAELRDLLSEMVPGATLVQAAEPVKLSYSVAEAADVLQCSTDIVYRFIDAGTLRASKSGKGYAIRGAELERFMCEREAARVDHAAELARPKRGRMAASA